MKILLTETALLLAVALACGAKAQVADAPTHIETVAVAYADLDLSQPAATRLLNNRLRSAALRVCGDSNLVVTAHRARHWCVKDAVQDGWNQVVANRAIQTAENRTIVIAALRARPLP